MPREVSFHVPSIVVVQGSRLPTRPLKLPKMKKLPNFDGIVLGIRGNWEHSI